MSAPTHEQRVRSALNGLARSWDNPEYGEMVAGTVAVREAIRLDGRAGVIRVLGGLMGAREVAAVLHVNSPNNVTKVSGLPEPVARVSGGMIPVWLGSDILEFAAEREKKRGRR